MFIGATRAAQLPLELQAQPDAAVPRALRSEQDDSRLQAMQQLATTGYNFADSRRSTTRRRPGYFSPRYWR